jgi:hypothetical protein
MASLKETPGLSLKPLDSVLQIVCGPFVADASPGY